MLQTFRDNMKGTMAFFIVGIMIIPFAMFGVDSLFLQDTNAGKAAQVDDSVISEMELSRAIEMQKQQLLERYGDKAPMELLSNENLRAPALNRLIQRQLLTNAAQNNGMTISDAALDEMIVAIPNFQQDGKFSPDLYLQLLRSRGYTPTSYKDAIRSDLMVDQLVSGVMNSAFTTAADLETLTALTQQERSFFYLTLPYESVSKGIEVSEEEVKEYYESNPGRFMSREQVVAQYVSVDLTELASKVEVTEEDIQSQFKQDSANYKPSVQSQVAHILIEEGEEAEAKISLVKEKLTAGEDFAQLAKEYSDDLGSNAFGGDLGLTDGATFPAEFEAAVALLEVGAVSPAVETDAGTHFIKLIDQQKSQAPVLADVREDIAEMLAKAAAEEQYLELLEELPDATYNSDDLAFSAETLGLTAVTSEPIGREGGQGILSNSMVMSALFSDELLNQRLTSDVIELSDEQVVVIRVKEYIPAEVKALSIVEADIIETLTREKAIAQLHVKSQSVIEQLDAGQSAEQVAKAEGLQWQVHAGLTRSDSKIDGQLLAHVFDMPKPKQGPVASSLVVNNGDLLVVQLTVVEAGKTDSVDPMQDAALRASLAQQFGDIEFGIYQESLQDTAQIDIY